MHGPMDPWRSSRPRHPPTHHPPSTQVLHAAGVERPLAIVVCYTARQRSVLAVEALHAAYPGVPIYARALDMQHAAALQEAGASTVVSAATEAGLAVGSSLARGLGVPGRTVAGLTDALRSELDARAAELAEQLHAPARSGSEGEKAEPNKVSIFKFDQSKAPTPYDDTIASDSDLLAGA